MADEREVLAASVARLRNLVGWLGSEQRRGPSYCDDWTVAQVLSHLGSGAVISQGRIDHAVGGGPDIDPQPIWDEWNAKDPDAMVTDGLAADAALVERFEAMTPDERAGLHVSFGPMEVDDAQFVRFRVNEHVVHTWDVEVVGDATATLQPAGVPIILGFLPMMAGFAGKPTGTALDLVVATTDPDQTFQVTLSEDAVSIAEGSGEPDLTLPAEALVRLVYGRLDPDHTPSFEGDEADLDELRKAFPGV